MLKIKNRFGYVRVLALLTTGGIASSACSAAPDEPSVGQVEEPIIAGFPANGAALNAIGSIGHAYVDEWSGETVYEPYCSGSLIGKQTVLTAKHCLQFFARDTAYGLKTMFAIGPDASAPLRLVEVVAVQGGPGDSGGFVGFGHDVGAMYLLEKITDVTPLKIGTVGQANVGKKFVQIGYGARDNTSAYGTRRTGSATLRAVSGKIFEIMFGSFERFESWYETGSPGSLALFQTGPVAPAAFLPIARSLLESGVGQFEGSEGGAASGGASAEEPPTAGNGGSGTGGSPSDGGEGGVGGGGDDYDGYLRWIYDNVVLDEGYEAVWGGAKGDAQACYGDSGSPIVKVSSGGVITAYGVVSGGVGSTELICDYGGVDATFGPDVKAFLTTAAKWVDPCKGTPVEGVCSGTTAKRCTGLHEGERRLIKFDCSSIAQVCAVQPDGTAGCSDP
jgi:Trypsin